MGLNFIVSFLISVTIGFFPVCLLFGWEVVIGNIRMTQLRFLILGNWYFSEFVGLVAVGGNIFGSIIIISIATVWRERRS